MLTIHDFPFYSGLSGLKLPFPKNRFTASIENAGRLNHYASMFNSIEYKNSFHSIPDATTLADRAASVPDNFKFTFKLWKGITHNNGLHFNTDDVSAFIDSINAVGEKKGSLLIQLPPATDKSNILQLARLLSCIQLADPVQEWKIAVEFRNNSWYTENVYDLLGIYNAAVVIHDMPQSATPYLNHVEGFIYLRFHGPAGNYRGSYPEDYLSEYANYIIDCLEEEKKVFIYFNNTMGEGYENALTLHAFIQNTLSPASESNNAMHTLTPKIHARENAGHLHINYLNDSEFNHEVQLRKIV